MSHKLPASAKKHLNVFEKRRTCFSENMYVFLTKPGGRNEQAKAASLFSRRIFYFLYGYSIAREIHLPAVVTHTSL